MTIVKTLAVGIFLASTLVATGAIAKNHDQGIGNGDKNGFLPPGENAVNETAAAAQTLGAAKGNSANAPGHNKDDEDE